MNTDTTVPLHVFLSSSSQGFLNIEHQRNGCLSTFFGALKILFNTDWGVGSHRKQKKVTSWDESVGRLLDRSETDLSACQD